MSDSWFDHIPSHEREKIRKRLRSPEEYEKLREKVKGPEDLEKEMEKNDALAELKFALETEPHIHDALKSKVEQDVREEGMDQILESTGESMDAKKAMEQGKFKLTVSSHPVTHQDQLTVVTEGNVQEKLPIKMQVSDRYLGQFQQAVRRP